MKTCRCCEEDLLTITETLNGVCHWCRYQVNQLLLDTALSPVQRARAKARRR